MTESVTKLVWTSGHRPAPGRHVLIIFCVYRPALELSLRVASALHGPRASAIIIASITMATDEVMASVAPAGGGGGALEAAAVPFSTLYCSNIDWKIKKQVLRRSLHALFSRHGKVRRCDLFCRCLPIIVSMVGAWVCDNWCPSRESVILPLCSPFLSLSPPLWAMLF